MRKGPHPVCEVSGVKVMRPCVVMLQRWRAGALCQAPRMLSWREPVMRVSGMGVSCTRCRASQAKPLASTA